MKEKPFIHCFRTYNCCYFYDFNTNAIYDNGVVLHWTRVSGVQANYNYDPVD